MTTTENATEKESVLTSVDPATGATLATYPIADEKAVAEAVAKARAAAPVWEDLGFEGRKKALLRWSSRLVAKSDEFCALIHAENGKPLDDAFLELMLALEHIAWAAKHAKKKLFRKRSRRAR